MSEIPSDIASSAAGAPIQSREAAKEQEARRAGQTNAAEKQVKAIDEADSVVETDDADTRVFSDAEGGGSQGRDLGEKDDSTSDDHPQTPGISTDEDGHTRLDVQA